MRYLNNFLLLVLWMSVSLPTWAKVTVADVLGDNMVLQRQADAAIWGTATPGATVTVNASWGKWVYTTTADADGRWRLTVRTPKAGGPYELTVREGSSSSLTLKNILIGEVWLCSGQSNMVMPLRGFDAQQVVRGAEAVISAAKPQTPIRMFTVEKNFSGVPIDTCKGTWREHTPQAVADCSATAYFFARRLQQALNVPVGIIITAVNGSAVQAWMSKEAIAPFREEVEGWSSSLYNGMLVPVKDYTVRGVLWYQGEANAHKPELYSRLLPAFVGDLRANMAQGDLPFYYVQIAPFTYNEESREGAPLIREVQARLMDTVPNSGMAVTIDIGNPELIHPADKEQVGERLAAWALARTYGKKGVACTGPSYQSMTVLGDEVTVRVKGAKGRLTSRHPGIGNFELAGADGVYHPASGHLSADGKTIIVRSTQVAHPVAVRYCFADYVKGTVYDEAGLPLAPFRTL